MSKASIYALIALVTVILLSFWAARRRPEPVKLVPTLTGEPEYCLTCHGNLPEISAAHPIYAFGCVTCHGGEGLALEAGLAHSTLRGGSNPSDLAVVEESCGGKKCHNGPAEDQRNHTHRILTGLHGTYAGAFANIRNKYGAQPDNTAQKGTYTVQDDIIETTTGVAALAAFDPSQETSSEVIKFGSNCLICHLSAVAPDRNEAKFITGCAACHTPIPENNQNEPLHHLTTTIPYTQCNTCHNQGNYDTNTITFLPRQDTPTNRFEAYYPPNTQFARCEWTLDCIDCHTRIEVMGDGDIHSQLAETQPIQCRTCHGTLDELPQTRRISSMDDLSIRLAFLNRSAGESWRLKPGDIILVTSQGEPLWNTRLLTDGTYALFGKVTGQVFTFRPVKGTTCQQKNDEQDSKYCHTCHQEKR